MDKFDEMSKQFKDFIELQEFSQAQHKTIVDLSKKITKLEDENSHLKELLANTAQLTNLDPKPMIVDLGISSEEIISATELRKLKEICISQHGELTLEQAKKVELYTKILLGLRNKGKGKSEADKLDDNALLSFVESHD